MRALRVFAATGSRSFPFDRMIQALDGAVSSGVLPEGTTVLAQVGSSAWEPRFIDVVDYLDRDEFLARVDEADLVVSHGGTGSLMTALSRGKRVVAVPRRAVFGEVVDDHQVEFVRQLERAGLLRVCDEGDDLAAVMAASLVAPAPSPYQSNTAAVLDSIDAYLGGMSESGSMRLRRPVRVLLCGSALTEPGGMVSVCRQLMNHDWGDDASLEYVATHVLGSPLCRAITFMRGLHEVRCRLASGEVDVVHLHMSYKGSFVRKRILARLCQKRGVRYVVHMHGGKFTLFYEGLSSPMRKAVTSMLENADTVVVLSESRREFCSAIAPNACVAVVPNAVPLRSPLLRKRDGAFDIAFLGRLVPVKGVDDLVCGFSQLIKRRPSLKSRLYIAGSGSEEGFLRRKCAALGIADCVSFLGWLDPETCNELLEKVDVVVLPSHAEEFGTVLIEAMSAGTPVVATKVGGIEAVVEDGVEGILVNAEAPEEIASALERLHDDVSFWESCSRASQEKVAAQFNEDVFFAKMVALCRGDGGGE